VQVFKINKRHITPLSETGKESAEKEEDFLKNIGI
jgi:hypothetical protein